MEHGAACPNKPTFIWPAPVASRKDDCRKIVPARIPALQTLACLLESSSPTISPSLSTPVPHQCSSSRTSFSSNLVSFSACTCSSGKTFWSIRSMSSEHPPRPRAGVRAQAHKTDPFLRPSTYIPLLYKEAFTHGTAVLLQATWISQAAQNC